MRRPSYPKENPATGEHGRVPGPMLWGSEYSTLGPLGQRFRRSRVPQGRGSQRLACDLVQIRGERVEQRVKIFLERSRRAGCADTVASKP
jgi:hypothetical protein